MKRLAYAVLLVGGTDEGVPSLPAEVKCLVSGDLGLAYALVEVGAIATTIPRLEAFASVVAALHRQRSIVPFRYGGTFASNAQIRALLQEHRPAWLAALRGVEHFDEYSVHLLPSRPPPPAETGEAEADQAPGPAESAERPGTSYLLARRAELARTGSHQKHAQEVVARVAQAVAGLYRKCHVDLESPRAGGLVTLVYLVPRRSAEAFLAALSRLSQTISHKLLTTGPWPPYHFVDSPLEIEARRPAKSLGSL